jgi:hypothetical protein
VLSGEIKKEDLLPGIGISGIVYTLSGIAPRHLQDGKYGRQSTVPVNPAPDRQIMEVDIGLPAAKRIKIRSGSKLVPGMNRQNAYSKHWVILSLTMTPRLKNHAPSATSCDKLVVWSTLMVPMPTSTLVCGM